MKLSAISPVPQIARVLSVSDSFSYFLCALMSCFDQMRLVRYAHPCTDTGEPLLQHAIPKPARASFDSRQQGPAPS